MANEVNSNGTAAATGHDQYRVTRTHEGPMGSLDEGSTLHVDPSDQRIAGMVEAGLVEKLTGDDNSETVSRRAAAKKRAEDDSKAANG